MFTSHHLTRGFVQGDRASWTTAQTPLDTLLADTLAWMRVEGMLR